MNCRNKKKDVSLKNKTISHLQKMFSYTLAKNKGEPASLKKNLLAITPPIFGDHSQCDISWCGFLKDSDNYEPKNLPYGKYLSEEDLKKDLTSIFNDSAERSGALSNLGSSQGNESFNYRVSNKASKTVYYGGSESLCYRVAAAGCEINKGSAYLLDMGPAGCQSCDSSAQPIEDADMIQIPAPVNPPIVERLPSESKYNFIYFDSETTGFGFADITQLSASQGDKEYNQFVMPSKPIFYGASAVTQLAVEDYKLYRNGSPVQTGAHFYELIRKRMRCENARIHITESLIDKGYVGQPKYPYSVLVKKNVPDDVDDMQKEYHLSEKQFRENLLITQHEFYNLPQWKQRQILRSARLLCKPSLPLHTLALAES